MAKRISIINFKGGVGKTTLAFHLGTGLAKYHNARVLLIDVDHQSSLSIAASHGYIIPVVPEAVMERGAPHLYGMVRAGIDTRLNALAAMGEPRKMYVSATKLVGLVITRIRVAGGHSGYTNDHTQHLDSLKRRWKNMLVKPYIVQGTGLSQALADGVPVYDRSSTQNVGGRGIHIQFEKLTAELKKRVDSL